MQDKRSIFVSLFSFCFFLGSIYGEILVVNKGIINLKDWNFSQSGIIKLTGEWEFYWDTLLYPGSFTDSVNRPVPSYIAVPYSWTSKKGLVYPARGYATYRMVIKMPDLHDVYALRFYDIFPTSCIWLDGRVIYSSGSVGTNKKKSVPGFSYCDVPVFFDSSIRQHELIVQVSNFRPTKTFN
ncbi:MAG: hypothetical protein JW973_15610 [Bacteroidales bacterium]|nr:hypothetical protein [Bacteroidales bacterium]